MRLLVEYTSHGRGPAAPQTYTTTLDIVDDVAERLLKAKTPYTFRERKRCTREEQNPLHPGCIDWRRPQLERITRLMMAAGIGRNHFRGITKMVAGTNTANQGKEDSHEV